MPAKSAEPGKRKKRKRKAQVVINLVNCKYEVVQIAAEKKNWRIIDDEEAKGWNVYWTDTSVSVERVMRLESYQKINHFPGMSTLSRKAGLAMNLTRMKHSFPGDYAFFPQTWRLPADYEDFKDQFMQKGTRTFIVKPDAGCQGKGIYLTRSCDKVDPTEPQVAQRYVRKPMLIDGYKFDLRIYILVLSCDPLRLYIYEDGLTRLCTEKYEEPHSRNLKNMCMHLTNYAINKRNDKFEFNTDAQSDGEGSKRSLVWFKQWLADNGHDVAAMWRSLDDMIIKTMLSVQPALAHNYRSCRSDGNNGLSCFEVLGLDVMFDRREKPWLIEVNHSPSFNSDTPLDMRIKEGVISSTLSMLNVHSYDRRRHKAKQSAAAQSRLYSGVSGPTAAAAAADTAAVDPKVAAWRKLDSLEKKHAGGFRRFYPPTEEGLSAGAKPMAAYRAFARVAQERFDDEAASRGGSTRVRSAPSHISLRMSKVTAPKVPRPAAAPSPRGGGEAQRSPARYYSHGSGSGSDSGMAGIPSYSRRLARVSMDDAGSSGSARGDVRGSAGAAPGGGEVPTHAQARAAAAGARPSSRRKAAAAPPMGLEGMEPDHASRRRVAAAMSGRVSPITGTPIASQPPPARSSPRRDRDGRAGARCSKRAPAEAGQPFTDWAKANAPRKPAPRRAQSMRQPQTHDGAGGDAPRVPRAHSFRSSAYAEGMTAGQRAMVAAASAYGKPVLRKAKKGSGKTRRRRINSLSRGKRGPVAGSAEGMEAAGVKVRKAHRVPSAASSRSYQSSDSSVRRLTPRLLGPTQLGITA